MPHLIKKIAYALADLPKAFRPTPHPRIVMTLLVKNEEDMLAQNLEFHRSMGVDVFIVTDNNSSDRTPDIIQQYQQRGWVLESISERATDYDQKRWVDRMVWMAKTKYHADWIINADADEFWVSPSGSLPSDLSGVRANVLRCEVRNMLPEEGQKWTAWRRSVRMVPNPEVYGLSRFSIYGRNVGKVLHRSAGYLQINMGNHKVKMFPYKKDDSPIVIYHFHVRSRQQFMQKMINGGRQLEQHKGKHGGRHWRYFYSLYKESEEALSAEYDRVVGYCALDQLVRDGYVVPDCPLPDLFAAQANQEQFR